VGCYGDETTTVEAACFDPGFWPGDVLGVGESFGNGAARERVASPVRPMCCYVGVYNEEYNGVM
jgi:hypothetical protein